MRRFGAAALAVAALALGPAISARADEPADKKPGIRGWRSTASSSST